MRLDRPGADGRIGIVASQGWEAEEIVTRQAVEELERLAADARRRALAGETSPLEYHMYRARMDITLLSQVTGLWAWRVRRHLRPAVFARLSPALRARYAARVAGTSPGRRAFALARAPSLDP